jgi:hypothetical protein
VPRKTHACRRGRMWHRRSRLCMARRHESGCFGVRRFIAAFKAGARSRSPNDPCCVAQALSPVLVTVGLACLRQPAAALGRAALQSRALQRRVTSQGLAPWPFKCYPPRCDVLSLGGRQT